MKFMISGDCLDGLLDAVGMIEDETLVAISAPDYATLCVLAANDGRYKKLLDLLDFEVLPLTANACKHLTKMTDKSTDDMRSLVNIAIAKENNAVYVCDSLCEVVNGRLGDLITIEDFCRPVE